MRPPRRRWRSAPSPGLSRPRSGPGRDEIGECSAQPFAVAASECEPEEPDPEPPIRLAEALEPSRIEDDLPVRDLDLRRRDRVQLGPDGRQDVAQGGCV